MIVRRMLGGLGAASLSLLLAGTAAGQAAPAKNWTPPAHKIYAQKLSDQTMAQNPELQSVTFHGVPPGMEKVYTMFAGSYPERIGNPDDPDDVDVIVKGITLVDPRWHRPKDVVKRFVIQEPLRDRSGENIGLIVYAFKTVHGSRGEKYYFNKAVDLRDTLAPKIPSYAALFEPAN